MHFRETIRSFDWLMTGATLLLLVISLAMLFSAPADGNNFNNRFTRQLFSFTIAFAIYFGVSILPYHYWQRYAVFLYCAGLTVLLLVHGLAPVIRGASSRLEFYGLQVQPSEFIKVALIIFFAWFFAKKGMSRFSVVFSLGCLSAVVTLIILEPDFGQAALIITFWTALIIFLGLPWSQVVIIMLICLAGLSAAWIWLFAGYQKARLITFIDPTRDPQGAGYNVAQSIIALGSGGFFGRGLGHGPQSQLKFLPEQHTDFILASIGEELGFIGIVLTVALYMILLWRILRVARHTTDLFGQYLAVGVYLLLLISFFVSAGMNMGLLPVTGVPLPLVSYGGSNLVGSFMMLGIVQSVHAYSRWVRQSPLEISDFT